MRFLVFLLAGMAALAGCSDDADEPVDEPMDDGDGTVSMNETELQDLGEYTLDTATGQCDAKSSTYTDLGGQVYQSTFGGGTWVMVETNGIPGLQLEDNHPLAGSPAGTFDLAVDPACTNGDQVAA